MKIGVRKPSLKKAIKASTTGKAKRVVKKAVNPLYGKKGVGLAKSPKRAVKNAVYKKTTVGGKRFTQIGEIKRILGSSFFCLKILTDCD